MSVYHKKAAAQMFSILIKVRNVSWAASHHVRLDLYHISKGSCDTEDWSNDAENSALHYRNKCNFNIQLLQIVMSQFYIFFFFTVFVI